MLVQGHGRLCKNSSLRGAKLRSKPGFSLIVSTGLLRFAQRFYVDVGFSPQHGAYGFRPTIFLVSYYAINKGYHRKKIADQVRNDSALFS